MKIFFKSFVFLVFFLSNLSFAVSAQNTVFVDIDYVLNNSNIGKSIYLDLETLNKKNLDILKSKEKKINQQKESIEKKKNISSQEQLKEDITAFQKKVEKYRKEKNEILQNFKTIKKDKLDNFLIKINPIIQTYMKENSIDIVFEKKQIFIGSVNKDITNIILELVNKNLN